MSPDRTPSRRQKSPANLILVAILFAVCGGLIAYRAQILLHGDGGDLLVTWRAVHFIRAGQDPYEAIKPFVGWKWNTYWFYPLPAAIIVAPVAWLPPALAALVFVSVSSGLLGFALARTDRPWFPVLLSVPFWYCAQLTQMTSAILAFALLTPLAGLTVIKPNLAVPLFAWRPSRRTLITATTLLVLSVVLYPHWPEGWYRSVAHSSTHSAPIMRPLGFIGLASIVRWRRPEARLLAVMTVAPAALCFYDELVLFLVATSAREAVILCAGGWLAWAATLMSSANDVAGAMLRHAPPWIFAGLYLPATIMVLRRPNEGDVPRWLEPIISRLPLWLRGRSRSASTRPQPVAA